MFPEVTEGVKNGGTETGEFNVAPPPVVRTVPSTPAGSQPVRFTVQTACRPISPRWGTNCSPSGYFVVDVLSSWPSTRSLPPRNRQHLMPCKLAGASPRGFTRLAQEIC
jgi:hypothetical protein